MAVRVRLTRVGSRKNPIWRVVVADQRSPRDGRFIEQIGHYNPQTEPSTIVIDRDRLDHWLERGAQPTNSVRKLMRAKPPEPGAPSPPAQEEAPAAGQEGAAADADAGAGDPSAEEPSAEEPSAQEPAVEASGADDRGAS